MPGHDMGDNDGCGDRNINKCQSIRDQLLSGTTSFESAAANFQRSIERPPACLAPAPPVRVFSGRSPPSVTAFHPIYKLPLSFSYLVLRL